MPKSRTEFWTAKFEGTIQRDQAAERALRDSGWKVTIVWECEISDKEKLASKLMTAIRGPV
jgi:DNA mismatch endonuclease (patch repair protein)